MPKTEMVQPGPTPVDLDTSSMPRSTHRLDKHSNAPDIVNSSSTQPSVARRLLDSVSPLAKTRSTSGPTAPRSSTAPKVVAPVSPCFVHCWLDKAASRVTRSTHPVPASVSAPAQSSDGRPLAPDSTTSAPSVTLSYDDDEEEDDSAGSITRKLVETAVSVREMSQQLGRTRIRSNIQSVLIVTKARDNRLIKLTRELALYLMLRKGDSGRGLVVYVDSQLKHSKRFAAGMQRDHPELFHPVLTRRRTSSNLNLVAAARGSSRTTPENLNGHNGPALYPSEEGQLRYWTLDMCTTSPHLFDFVVTLGGDGTVLFTSWLFQRIVPPVLPFALGSLGFLTNFDFSDYQAVMEGAIESGIRVNLRMRFTCTVYRAVSSRHGKGKKGDASAMLMKALKKGGWEAIEGGVEGGEESSAYDSGKVEESMRYRTRPEESFEVLNDLVIDRGLNPYISLLELFGDEHHMTTVQADGLCIATPTGSTAYSLAAGGSLVNPEIPAMLITPICPHTLSFRPILLPDTMELRICVPYNSRSSAWASFDGRGRIELKQGDHLKVTASKYPFPTACSDKPSTDWFHAISRTLKWNDRERQKSFVVVEDDPASTKRKSPYERGSENITNAREDEEDEGEETFDIDDLVGQDVSSSPDNASSSLTREPSPRTGTKAPENGGIDTHCVYGTVGTDSPDRFHARAPHPPRLSPRHLPPNDTGTGAMCGDTAANALNGDPDNIADTHTVHHGGHSRLALQHGGDVGAESMHTPRASDSTTSPLRSRVGTFDINGREETDCSASNCSTC